MSVLPELQGGDTGLAARAPTEALHDEPCCDLCCEPIPPAEFDPETLRATGFAVCVRCIEDSL